LNWVRIPLHGADADHLRDLDLAEALRANLANFRLNGRRVSDTRHG
jgi:hypothetical protein